MGLIASRLIETAEHLAIIGLVLGALTGWYVWRPR